MDLKLVCLVALAVVSVSAVDKPKICSNFVLLPDEKRYLCYVKQDLTRYQASRSCIKNGMTLFNVDSADAVKAISDLGKSVFGGSQKAKVFVNGVRGRMCSIYRGNGRSDFQLCSNTNHFVCEMSTLTYKSCTSYDTFWNDNQNIDLTGYSNPGNCNYWDPITTSNFIINVDPNKLTQENVISLDIAYNYETLFLPRDIAESFPKLQLIYAKDCSISSISYKSLKNLSQLKYLALDGNQLTVLDGKVFKDLGNLLRLDFRNPMTSLSSTIFTTTLPLLRELYMNDASNCLNTVCSDIVVGRTCVARLPGSVTSNTCTLIP